MTQAALWFETAAPSPPRARNSDPETSHQAAREVTDSGQADTEAARVLEVLEHLVAAGDTPTSRELAQWGRIDRYIVARRLPELRDRGLVTNHHPRRCNVSGRNAMTWSTKGRTACSS